VNVFRPNFTGVARKDANLIVSGESDDFDEVTSIRVILSQENKIEGGSSIVTGAAPRVGSTWNVVVKGAPFVGGKAVAFGVETRSVNAQTTTWAEVVDIP
jgi:hypothetical protein